MEPKGFVERFLEVDREARPTLRPTRPMLTERTCSACAFESLVKPLEAAGISTWKE